jgi:hypothetical protein
MEPNSNVKVKLISLLLNCKATKKCDQQESAPRNQQTERYTTHILLLLLRRGAPTLAPAVKVSSGRTMRQRSRMRLWTPCRPNLLFKA